MRLALVLALPLLLSCAAAQSQPTDAGVDWAAEINVGLTLAHAVDPMARQIAAQDSALTPAQHAALDTALVATDASIPVLQDAVTAYENAHRAPSLLCGVWTALHAAIGARLDVVTMLQGFGLAIPADVAILVGVLGSVADAIVPTCSTAHAAMALEMPRIRAVFAHVSATASP